MQGEALWANTPRSDSFDVVIAGGGIMGTATAFFLASNPDFGGSVLVTEPDPSFEFSSTARSNSCIRQQFSNHLNIEISKYAADFLQDLPRHLKDEAAPKLKIRDFGYLYLANDDAGEAALRAAHEVQHAAGAGTRLLDQQDLRERYPFMELDDILLASHNRQDEGYWGGMTVFDWMRRKAHERGAVFVRNQIASLETDAALGKITAATLRSGERIRCGHFVNATGPRAAQIARMAGIDIPVEPRKRYSYVFRAAQPLENELPLVIEPSGVHFRQDGTDTYLVGGHDDPDPGVDPEDFSFDHSLWERHIWPAMATRIPQFERVKVLQEWVGH